MAISQALADDVVLSTSADGHSHLWDLKSATALTAYKGSCCGRRAVTLIGKEYLAVAQNDKPAIHVWYWQKDQAVHKFIVPEKLQCLAASPDGLYLVGGSATGKCYLWEMPTGLLLRIWEAHFKTITVVRFSDDGDSIFTGGEDAAVYMWRLACRSVTNSGCYPVI
eukprot:Colp12_sorted_trinity150504_noHs@24117